MKSNSKKNLLVIFKIVLFTLILASCGSTKEVAPIIESSVSDFTIKTLTNGIPVVFKQNKGSKIVVLRMIFEGGSSAIDETLGGLEDVTFDMILRGSQEYPYEKIRQLEYEKSFSLTSSVGKDFSTLGFTCIQRDMSEVLTIFADCLLNPQMSQADFGQKMNENSSSIASRNADPSGALSLALTRTAFAGHPYSTTNYVTAESFKNINLDLVHGHYEGLLNALRIKFVIIGNFTKEDISNFLNQ